MSGENKKVNVIRHLAFEDLGGLATVLQARGYQINYYEAACDDLSKLDALSDDLLIILGGPVSVNDAAMFAFIDTEINLLKRRLKADKATLGICLGAQLMAAALGEKIYPAKEKEIGWSELSLTEQGKDSALKHLDAKLCNMLHWHGETFGLPAGATLLASTSVVKNQAFSYANKCLALQFHPEVTRLGMEEWFVGHIAEIMQTSTVNVPDLRQQTQQFAPALEKQGQLFFDNWLRDIQT